jgi:hypothetical protein
VILIEVVAGVLLALGSVLIIRALIVTDSQETDSQEALAAERQKPAADQRQAA